MGAPISRAAVSHSFLASSAFSTTLFKVSPVIMHPDPARFPVGKGDACNNQSFSSDDSSTTFLTSSMNLKYEGCESFGFQIDAIWYNKFMLGESKD